MILEGALLANQQYIQNVRTGYTVNLAGKRCANMTKRRDINTANNYINA